MRILVLIGLASVTLAAGVLDAEARGGRLRFGALRLRALAPAAPVRSVPREAIPAPSLAVRPEMGAAARPTYVVLPSPPSRPGSTAEAPAPVAAAKAVEAAPWCPSQRVVGSGAGFCVIN